MKLSSKKRIDRIWKLFFDSLISVSVDFPLPHASSFFSLENRQKESLIQKLFFFPLFYFAIEKLFEKKKGAKKKVSHSFVISEWTSGLIFRLLMG